MLVRVGIVCAVVLAGAGGARADDLPPITSRDYAIDLYGGAALGSVRVVAMGGAAIADAEGAPGALVNPAAAAVRPATSRGSWDWDWTFDAQQAVRTSDLDNNGRQGDHDARLASFGLLGNWRLWAIGLAGTSQSESITVPDPDPTLAPHAFDATATRGRFEIARVFPEQQVTLGFSIEEAAFSFAQAGGRNLMQVTGTGFGVGGVWRPDGDNLRVGAIASTAVSGSNVQISDPACAGADTCEGFYLPRRIEAPWQIGAGVAQRWAPTGWNQHVETAFRDEPAVTVAGDVLISGPVADGYGLEAFGQKLWQRSGAKTVVSVRGGVEWEVVPGHVRVRGGSYWEPGRFSGVSGRAHVTAGIELGALQFDLISPRRMRLSFTADIAPRYGTATISIGFWH